MPCGCPLFERAASCPAGECHRESWEGASGARRPHTGALTQSPPMLYVYSLVCVSVCTCKQPCKSSKPKQVRGEACRELRKVLSERAHPWLSASMFFCVGGWGYASAMRMNEMKFWSHSPHSLTLTHSLPNMMSSSKSTVKCNSVCVCKTTLAIILK